VVKPNFKIVRASSNFQGGRFIDLPAERAREGLRDELRHWTEVLSPKQPPSPAPGSKTPPAQLTPAGE
jgi:hypothetical protein